MFKKILIANRGEIACRIIKIRPSDHLCLSHCSVSMCDAGVQGIYGPRSNIVECAADGLLLLGHNMPPVGELT